jgi:transcriptional antiterminator NusG
MQAIYCLFCRTGKEAAVEAALKEQGFEVISTFFEMTVFKKGVKRREVRCVMPGYVFFMAETEPDWEQVLRTKYVYRALAYGDGTRALRGADREFVYNLLHRGRIAEVSHVVRVGTKIRVIDGPLKDYEGRITKVNRKRSCAWVALDTEGFIGYAWLQYEEMGEGGSEGGEKSSGNQ